MKRIFALLLAAVSLISLTACAQPEAKTVSKYQLAALCFYVSSKKPKIFWSKSPEAMSGSDGQ